MISPHSNNQYRLFHENSTLDDIADNVSLNSYVSGSGLIFSDARTEILFYPVRNRCILRHDLIRIASFGIHRMLS